MLQEDTLRRILARVAAGEQSETDALAELLGYSNLGHTRVDTDRRARTGWPEAIYGAGKTPAQIAAIARTLLECGEKNILITRLPAGAAAALAGLPHELHEQAQCAVVNPEKHEREGMVLVLCAGTSDLAVAREAAVTAETMGANTQNICDVGVAGIHRLLAHEEMLRQANVIVAVAGMEGALPSVVAGLTDKPVIAVPTSVGYGTNFGGVTALLAMLNSCGSGVSVVNIDNGFGAGYAAAQINRLAAKR